MSVESTLSTAELLEPPTVDEAFVDFLAAAADGNRQEILDGAQCLLRTATTLSREICREVVALTVRQRIGTAQRVITGRIRRSSRPRPLQRVSVLCDIACYLAASDKSILTLEERGRFLGAAIEQMTYILEPVAEIYELPSARGYAQDRVTKQLNKYVWRYGADFLPQSSQHNAYLRGWIETVYGLMRQVLWSKC